MAAKNQISNQNAVHQGFLTRCVNYLKQVITLSKRVTWPNRRATLTTTIAVMAMVSITCIFFLVVDQVIGFGLHTLFQIGG